MPELDPEFAHRSLPKWPQLYITGVPVTEEQAKAIIFATDGFLTSLAQNGGNNHAWEGQVARKMGVAEYHRQYGKPFEEMRDFWEMQEVWKRHTNALSCNYLHNTWAASCYIGGPYGWCHPTGRIFYADNVGKWPSVTEVYEDFVAIAERWEFLELTGTLMNGESGELTTPVVTFKVKAGKVEVKDPGPEYLNDHFERSRGADPVTSFILNIDRGGREQGLPQPWVDEYAQRVADFIKGGGGVKAIAEAERAKEKQA